MEKKSCVVISAIGKDRPGIVSAVSKVLFEAGCNLEDSNMTILQGEFAMILIVSLPKMLTLSILDQKFNVIREEQGLSVFIRPLTGEEMGSHTSRGSLYMISVYGNDQTGIVYRVSQLLADHQANITDVSTKRTVQDHSSLYMMMLEVECPKHLDLTALEKQLNQLAKDLAVTITFHPIDTLTL
jgi:glycine cleavage system transcriptional repressor